MNEVKSKQNVKKVLVVVHDPGGARCVSAVLATLKGHEGLAITIFASRFAQPILEQDNLKAHMVEDSASQGIIERILDERQPDVLLTGTSGTSYVEQQFRNVAYQRNIKSVLILDFWSNATLRWPRAIYPLSRLPDIVCVMDEEYKQHMVEQGFSKDALIVTGQPYLERLHDEHLGQDRIESIHPQSFLFLSQPLDLISSKCPGEHPLVSIVAGLEKYANNLKKQCLLTVKPHPREDKEAISSVISSLTKNSRMLEVYLTPPSKNIYALIKEHDLIVGNTTMGLFEARALGKRAVSLDMIHMEEPLRGVIHAMGIDIIDRNRLAGFLFNLPPEASSKSIAHKHRGAISRIISILYGIEPSKVQENSVIMQD